MLVLSRKLSEQILIGSDISIRVLKIDRKHVRVGVSAPQGVAIVRDELVQIGGGAAPPSSPASYSLTPANARRAKSPTASDCKQ